MTVMWEFSTLAEACEIKPAKAEVRTRLADTDAVSFVPMADLGISQKYVFPRQTRALSEVVGSYTYFADGDVLLAKITPCFENGKLGIAKDLEGGVGFGSSEYIVFRPGPKLHAQWLYYFLSRDSFRVEGEARMGGAVGHKRVAKEFIETYPVPLPSVKEQQRIVGILDEAFAGIATAKANAEKNLRNARALFESRLESVFTQPADDWKTTTLGAEIDLLVGFAFKSARYTNSDESIRLLRGDNIIQGCLRWDDAKKWPADDVAAYERYQLREGDVVLAMDRPWVKAGLKRAVISADDLPCLLVQRTACLRSRTDLDNRFLMHMVGSGSFIRHIVGVQTGLGVPHVSGQQIKDFAFSLPSLVEQRKTADRLDSLSTETQRLESIYKRKLVALDALKQSLLHQAFSGQLP